MKRTYLKYMAVIPVMCFAVVLIAAPEEAQANPNFYIDFWTNILLFTAGLVIVGGMASIVYLANMVMAIQKAKLIQEHGLEAVKESGLVRDPWYTRLYRAATKSVPVAQEQDVMLDHNYDGIRELDNQLPPWWVAMFYVTIVYAVIYLGYFHITGAGMTQAEAYQAEVEQAEEQIKAYLATQADLVDESNVTTLTDDEAIATGESIYQVNCVACHGIAGEGGVGPNLTDAYWIHGGGIKDIFKTIKYGVPEKGMIAWKAQLRPTEMHKIASFIMTLKGTNPPNGKEPQGELYEQVDAPVTQDSTDQAIGMIDTE